MINVYRLKKQTGFSLIEIMIATTIWSIVALGVGYGVVQVQKSQNNMVSQDLAMNLKKNLSSQLKSGGLCRTILNGTNLVYNPNLEFINIGNGRVNFVNDLLTKTNTAEVVDSIRNADITSIRYRVKSNTGLTAQNSKIVQMNDSQQKIKTVEFEFGIAYLKASGNSTVAEDYESVVPFTFELPVYTNMADQFVSCNLDFNMGEMCSSLGYKYDARSNKCTANNNLCIIGDIFAMSTMMDLGQANVINEAIAAGGGPEALTDPRYIQLKKFYGIELTAEDLADLNDEAVYENAGTIRVECVTPESNDGLGCACKPGFEAREASFFTKNRTVTCGKKCTTDVNMKLRTFMCIKCEK